MPNNPDRTDNVNMNTAGVNISNVDTVDAHTSEPAKMVSPDHKSESTMPVSVNKPAAPMQKRLMITWLMWLVYRLIGLPILINVFNQKHPDIIGGIAWQGLWLIPAFIVTPWMLRGRSPYALLVASMLTLVYLGASGVVLFTRVYGSGWLEIGVYLLDFLLLLLINIWLFILLKRLPSMNNVVKKPRSH